jgi:hypothetical protein
MSWRRILFPPFHAEVVLRVLGAICLAFAGGLAYIFATYSPWVVGRDPFRVGGPAVVVIALLGLGLTCLSRWFVVTFDLISTAAALLLFKNIFHSHLELPDAIFACCVLAFAWWVPIFATFRAWRILK